MCIIYKCIGSYAIFVTSDGLLKVGQYFFLLDFQPVIDLESGRMSVTIQDAVIQNEVRLSFILKCLLL